MAKASKLEIPETPKLPTPEQMIEDLRNADLEDPVFFEPPDSGNNDDTDENFQIAKDFMMTTTKLRDLTTLLASNKSQLEDNYKELCVMSENIRQQATEALLNIYSN